MRSKAVPARALRTRTFSGLCFVLDSLWRRRLLGPSALSTPLSRVGGCGRERFTSIGESTGSLAVYEGGTPSPVVEQSPIHHRGAEWSRSAETSEGRCRRRTRIRCSWLGRREPAVEAEVAAFPDGCGLWLLGWVLVGLGLGVGRRFGAVVDDEHGSPSLEGARGGYRARNADLGPAGLRPGIALNHGACLSM